MTPATGDAWRAGDAYEGYMGRWSRLVAAEFVRWLAPPPGAHWLELGCGTGALTTAIRDACEPASVLACDPSPAFVEHAARAFDDLRVRILVAGADALPRRDGGFGLAVSGLVFNFLPDPAATLAALRARTRPASTLAGYVWDYADGMEFLRHFWDAAVALDPGAAASDEGARFPLCRRDVLESLWRAAGLVDVTSTALEVPTRFASFDDYWAPFLRGTGPAPAYVEALAPDAREALAELLRARLGAGPDGAIALRARAWAVRGTSA